MRRRVAVLGDAVVDVHVSGAPPRLGADVPAAIRLEPGGQGANLAVRLARRGIRVRLGCALADDAAGRLVRERLADEGVEVVAAPTERTGTVVVLVGPDGERSMLSQRVPLMPVLDARALDTLVADVELLAVSGYVLLEADAAALAASLAEAPDGRVVLGCALTEAESGPWLAVVSACRPSMLVLNAEEAATVTGLGDAADAAAQLAEHLRAAVVVTQPGGAVAVVDRRRLAVSVPSTAEVVDTTGAGDAFAAALLATLGPNGLNPPSLERAMGAAVEAGSAATRVVGAQGRIPGEDDPDRLAP